jgi:hypothetical protein
MLLWTALRSARVRGLRFLGVTAAILGLAAGAVDADVRFIAGGRGGPRYSDHGHDHHDHHPHYHGGYGSGFTYYSAGSGFGLGLGYSNFSVYSGVPAYWGPPIVGPSPYYAPYAPPYTGYGNVYPYGGFGGVTSPYVYPQAPNVIERAPIPSGAYSLPMLDQDQPGQTIGRDPLSNRIAAPVHPTLVKPSTPEAQLRALRLKDMGDQQIRALRYANAAQAYEKAIEAAPDIIDPYFRLAIAMIGKGRLVEAADLFDRAASIDSSLPWRADKLDTVLGPENRLAKEQLKEAVVQWANNDVRDTRRLFLLGVVMQLDGDPRAKGILESASKLGMATAGLQAFLNPPTNLGPSTPPTPAQPGALPVPPEPGIKPVPTPVEPFRPISGTLPPAPSPASSQPTTVPVLPREPMSAEPTPANGGGNLPLPVAPSPPTQASPNELFTPVIPR